MSNVPWLSAYRSTRDVAIIEHTRAFRSLSLLDQNTTDQFPVLVAMIGRRTKSLLLRNIFQRMGEVVPYEPHGQVRVWSDPESRKHRNPTIFLDCEIHDARDSQSMLVRTEGTDIRRQIQSDEKGAVPWTQRRLGLRLYAQVLAPLTSVMIMFTKDNGGLKGTSEALAEQAISRIYDDTRQQARVRILVVAPLTSRPASADCNAATRALQNAIVRLMLELRDYSSEDQARHDLYSYASSIEMVSINDRAASDERLDVFREALAERIHRSQSHKRLAQRQFTLNHSAAFLGLALERFTSRVQDCFILPKACRLHLGPSNDFAHHLEELLSSLQTQRLWLRVAVPLLCSALLLDAYPPGMHCMTHYWFNAGTNH